MRNLYLSMLGFALFKLEPAYAALEPCLEPDVASLPFCDTNLPHRERAKDLVSRLNTTEKYHQLVNSAPAIDKLHIDPYQWWTESLHGVLSDCTEDGRCATSYPMPIGIGATFNMKLVKQMASQVSTEGRRFYVDRAKATFKWGGRAMGLDFWYVRFVYIFSSR